MLKNYFLVSLRNIRRQPGYSFINISGLAVGMAAFVMISLFVRSELAFDQHHPNGDRVVQVQLSAAVAGQEIHTASSPAVMAGVFLETYPEVVDAARIDDQAPILVEYGDIRFQEARFFYADSSVFNLFSLPLVRGDARRALNRPGTVVLSQEAARRYFGEADPMGQTLRLDRRLDLEVTGVFEASPRNAHFRPDLIASYLTHPRWDDPVWLNNSFNTYLLLRSPEDIVSLQAKMPDAVRTFAGPGVQQFLGISLDEALAAGFRYDWLLEPMPDLYLHNQADDQMGASSDVRYVALLGIIALFILAIACVNFMNLATARAAGRAREVGVRKALGSDRTPLIRQFLSESVTLSVISMLFALGLVLVSRPLFNAVAGTNLTVGGDLVAALLAVSLITGLAAGAYPAFFLSGFSPAEVLRGRLGGAGRGGRLRAGLVVFQFAVSVTLLIGTSMVFRQLQYIQAQEVGFERADLVVLPIETRAGIESFETFRSRASSLAEVQDVAASGIMPGPNRIHNNTGFRGESMRPDAFFVAAAGEVTHNYVETLGLELVAGRDFDEAFETDREAWVINEAAAREMGFTPEEAVGKRLARLQDEGEDRWGEVIGVVRNAHFRSLHWDVEPMVFGNRADGFGVRYAMVRLEPGGAADAISNLEPLYADWETGYPFSYYFLDADYDRFYAQERRLGTIYTSFSVLAILIACLGLFGLSAFVITERTKEIGVRKVLGASVPGIVLLLSARFTLLVVGACAIAFPLAWFAMSEWLAGFAYAVPMSWTVFAASGFGALLIAWLTVSYQSIRAATRNPVKSLRYE